MPAIQDDAPLIKKICLTPACGKPPAFKGLCMKCYSAAKKLVEGETTTWEALAQMGLCDLASEGDKFLAAFHRRKDQN